MKNSHPPRQANLSIVGARHDRRSGASPSANQPLNPAPRAALLLSAAADRPWPVVAGVWAAAGLVGQWLKQLREQALAHEWAFGAYLLLVASWLTVDLATTHAAPPAHSALLNVSLAFWALFLVGPVLVVACAQRPSAAFWRVRLLWYPSAMGISFYALPFAIAALARPNADAALAQWDLAMLGQSVSDLCASWLSALGTPQALTYDVLMAAYVFFFYYLIAGPGYYVIHNLDRARACFAGLFTIYALGFSGYLLLPAAGPHTALHFANALPLGPLAQTLGPWINQGSNGIDAFPSIHVAASSYLLGFDYTENRRRFRQLAIPCMLLWVSTMALRYHYLIDVIVGFLVAGLGLWTARQTLLRQSTPT